METEFKEKTYEKYFSHEIARLTNTTFSPDQIDEGLLGFDDAFLIPIPWLARYAPFVRRARTARMHGILIQEIAHLVTSFSRRMPPFRFNLFVQYKRPEHIVSHFATEWPDWQVAYYRYKVTPHQHVLLEQLEIRGRGRAATVYASPAFWRAADLWTHVQNESIIESSNITSVIRLNGHGRYSYVRAGFQGKAHSDTSDISSSPLQEIIDSGRRAGERLPLAQHLKNVADLIKEVVRTSDAATALYSEARATRSSPDVTEDPLIDAILTIDSFSDAFDISLYPVSDT